MAYTLKIGVIGPPCCGKTRMCNLLGNVKCTTEYVPTTGVRIVEVLEQLTAVNPENPAQKVDDISVKVQFYDCSSASKYSHLWSAWGYNLNAMIMFTPKEKSTLRDQ